MTDMIILQRLLLFNMYRGPNSALPAHQQGCAGDCAYVSRLEEGASYPRLDIIAKLATVVEVEPAALTPSGSRLFTGGSPVRRGLSAAIPITCYPPQNARMASCSAATLG